MGKFIDLGRLKTYSQEQILKMVSHREGETKLGECLEILSGIDHLHVSAASFILIGLPEDVGVRANFGLGGAHTAWESSLHRFLNIQSTGKLKGDEVGLLGFLDFKREMNLSIECDLNTELGLKQIRALVAEIDQHVFNIVLQIFKAGKIPILIGGGHNNSYPILKALSHFHQQPINTINIDAHADFRALEGRHSGNGFSYAAYEKYLNKYAVIGLHENYNSQVMLDQMTKQSEQIFYSFLEDHLYRQTSYKQSFEQAMKFTEGICGLEIDLDCMIGILSSAGSLTGFTTNQVREMIAQTASKKIAYLHITEGASKLNDRREDPLIGKLIATLISDFIKAQI